MLMDHAHPQLNGSFGAEVGNLLSLDREAPPRWRVNAVENVHEGTLSRPVLPHQGKNFPLMYRQGHVIVGQHPGKFHGNVRKLNYRLLQTDHLPFQSCFFLKKGPAMIRLETKARRGRSCVFIIRNLVQLSTWKTENPTWTLPVARLRI